VDILGALTLDWFTAATWLLAIAVFLLMFLWHPRRLIGAALGAALVFMTANIGVGIYILTHSNDPRWSRPDRLSAPELSDAPVVGRFLEPLDSLMGSVVSGINDVRAFQDALPTAVEFFTAAGWAALTAVPLALAALVAGYVDSRRRRAEFVRQQHRIEDLQQQLEALRRFVNYPGS